jgi:hypothetical protein
MKKYLLLAMAILLFISLVAETKQLNDFEDLMDSLLQGEQVRVVIYYGECKLMIDGQEVDAPEAIGGMEIDTFEYFAPGSVGNEIAYVVFSKSKLINLGGYLYNYAKLRVYADGKVEITAQYADPQTYEISMDETFISEINNKKNKGAVYFYLID